MLDKYEFNSYKTFKVLEDEKNHSNLDLKFICGNSQAIEPVLTPSQSIQYNRMNNHQMFYRLYLYSFL